jgi:hypothetical protein
MAEAAGYRTIMVIGALPREDCFRALREPAHAAGAGFSTEALDEIYTVTTGYPYFVQEWGYHSWMQAPTPGIGLDIVRPATPRAVERLDTGFFRVRFDRLAAHEKRFLRAMADLGPEPQRVAAIAERLRMKAAGMRPSVPSSWVQA